jgi:G3E family GTPase
MSQGCICCSLVGDFEAGLKEVIEKYDPDRIMIEPSGVGKLSDVMAAVKKVADTEEVELNSATTVADAKKAKIYMKNFGEFFDNQIENAGAIILSRTQNMDEEKLEAVVALLREKNAKARIITTPWDNLSGERILEVMEEAQDLTLELMALAKAEEDDDDDEDEHEHHHHHHHHEDHDHHEHDHEDHDHEEHEHHHHDHDDDDDHDEDHDHEEHEHEHHHHDHDDDDEDEHEHHHHHHHHHGEDDDHDADEIFQSWGVETPKKFDREKLTAVLEKLSESSEYGQIVRAKGMVELTDGTWAYFDMVPEEIEIREGAPDYTGRLCVIGAELKEEKMPELFGL